MNMWLADPVYLFSTEKGYLLLREELRKLHSIRSVAVEIDSNNECFGGPMLQMLLENFIGYDAIILNALVAHQKGEGFVYSTRTKELFDLRHSTDKTHTLSVSAVSPFELDASTNANGLHKSAEGQGLEYRLAFKLGVLFMTCFLFFVTTTLVSFTLRETQQ